MSEQRKLKAGEIALARTAFGDRIDYDEVELSNGPGIQPLAHLAFAKGNPAITVGSTVYFKKGYCPDFAAPAHNPNSFFHELTHVWQYQRFGMPAFFGRYGVEFAKVGGDAGKMYRYGDKEKFKDAMLEAQAQMVGDYGEAVWAKNAARRDKIAVNLAGSGLFGL